MTSYEQQGGAATERLWPEQNNSTVLRQQATELPSNAFVKRQKDPPFGFGGGYYYRIGRSA